MFLPHRDPWWGCVGCYARLLSILVALFAFFSVLADILWSSP